MEQHLKLCWERSISFDELARRTRKDWVRLAQYLLRRWKAPVGVLSEEDLVQELLIGCYLALRDFDPTRGTTLRAYVIFNSVDKAKKHLHTQRKAFRRDDNAPSRNMIPVSALHRDGEEPVDVADLVVFLADQDDRLDATRALRDVPERLRPALRSYVNEGNLAEAAWTLLADVEACRALGVASSDEARSAVEDAVGILVDSRAWEILEDQPSRERLNVHTLSDARRAVLSDVA